MRECSRRYLRLNQVQLLLVVLGISCVAGCGSAPLPIALTDLEATDQRFASPAPSEPKRAMDDLLKKEELTLEEVLVIADLMNPELASERKNIDLAAAAVWEAKLYPNPSLLLGLEDYRTNSTLGSSKRTAGLSIPLVFSGRIGAATSQAEKEQELAAVTYVWKRREILSDVKRAFLGLLASRRTAELARETRDLAKTLNDVTNERFKAQAIPEMELLKSAVNLAKSDVDLKLAEKDLAVSLKTLHARMGQVDFPQDKFSGVLASRYTVPSLEALRGHVTTVHPLLEGAVKFREAAELQLSVARRERLPDIGLDITAGVDSGNDTIVQAGITIPLPIFNRNQAKIAAAEARIQQAEFKLQAAKNDLVLRLTEAYRNFTAAQERVTVYTDEIMPKAQKALDQTNEGYRQGKFGYLDVLDSQRTLAEAKIAYAAALADLNLSAAELEKLTGMRMERVR
jgi:cobalt-zinc-cadmium efflux system outer membrane protein